VTSCNSSGPAPPTASTPTFRIAYPGYQRTIGRALTLCRCTQPGGIVSVMALNAGTLAVRPALDGHWVDALAAFDAPSEVGVLGGDTVEARAGLLKQNAVDSEAW